MRAFLLLVFFCASVRSQTVSALALRGYSAIPQPQRVEISASDVRFGPDWSLESSSVETGDVAVATLESELKSRFGFRRMAGAADSVHLVIASGAIVPGKSTDPDKQSITEQAYKLEIKDHRIVITANARPGCGVNRGKLQSNFSLTAAKSDRACCLMEWNDDRRTTFRKLKTRFYQPISEDRIIGKSA